VFSYILFSFFCSVRNCLKWEFYWRKGNYNGETEHKVKPILSTDGGRSCYLVGIYRYIYPRIAIKAPQFYTKNSWAMIYSALDLATNGVEFQSNLLNSSQSSLILLSINWRLEFNLSPLCIFVGNFHWHFNNNPKTKPKWT